MQNIQLIDIEVQLSVICIWYVLLIFGGNTRTYLLGSKNH